MINCPGKKILVPVHAWKFGFARQVWPSRPVSACSFSILTLNLVLTQGIPPNVRSGVHINLRQYAIGSVTTLQAYKVYCTRCVCVCFLPIHSGHQVRWTYQPGSHRRKVTQNFLSTFFLRCVPQFFSRKGFSHSFPSSTVKSNFVY